MALEIWKYPILNREWTMDIKHSAEILSVDNQHNIPCIWAMVNPNNPPSPRRVRMVMTGEAMPEGEWGFLGTVLCEDGNFVLHVFVEGFER